MIPITPSKPVGLPDCEHSFPCKEATTLPAVGGRGAVKRPDAFYVVRTCTKGFF